MRFTKYKLRAQNALMFFMNRAGTCFQRSMAVVLAA